MHLCRRHAVQLPGPDYWWMTRHSKVVQVWSSEGGRGTDWLQIPFPGTVAVISLNAVSSQLPDCRRFGNYRSALRRCPSSGTTHATEAVVPQLGPTKNTLAQPVCFQEFAFYPARLFRSCSRMDEGSCDGCMDSFVPRISPER